MQFVKQNCFATFHPPTLFLPLFFCEKSLPAPLDIQAAPDAKPRRAMALSRPLVASSAKSSVGSVNSSVAKAKRRRSPPGNVPRQVRQVRHVTESKLSSRCVLDGGMVLCVHVGVVHVGVSPPEIPAPIDPMSVFLHFERPNSVIKASDL